MAFKQMPKGMIDNLKEIYKPGTRVELVRMDDVQAPQEGTQGSVIAVDDMGTIHVQWDTGSTLGAVYGEDRIKIVK